MNQYHKTNGFTPKEEKELQSLLKEIENLKAREPKKATEQCTVEEYEAIRQYVLNNCKGERPQKADLFEPLSLRKIQPISIDTLEECGIVERELCDPTWETWHDELSALQVKYSGIIFAVANGIYEQAEESGGTIQEAIDKAIEETPPIEQLRSILPKNYVMPNNKLANKIVNFEYLDGKPFPLDTEIKKPRHSESVVLDCTVMPAWDDLELSNITEYDRCVSNAVTSLYVYGDDSHNFTPAMVYRTMINETGKKSPSKAQIAKITKSLDKMRFTRLMLDCTEEMRAYGITIPQAECKIDTYLLPMEKVSVKAGGKVMEAYHLIKEPTLYNYSKKTNQVITVPADILSIPGKDNTEQNIEIKSYLLHRTAPLRKAEKASVKLTNRIAITTLYKQIGISSPSRTESNRIRNYITAVLTYWKQKGFIDDFEFLKKGNKITTIAIYTGIFQKPKAIEQ